MDKEEFSQLREVSKVMVMPGYAVIMAHLALERERQLKALKNAKTEGHFQFLRGQLNGFDAMVNVLDRLKDRIDEEAQKKPGGPDEQ